MTTLYVLQYQESSGTGNFFIVNQAGRRTGPQDMSLDTLLEAQSTGDLAISDQVPDDVLAQVRARYAHPDYIQRISRRR